jgi:8-hydroxy-5-deazaflavin:NADPH oxidoreductase
MAQKPGIGIIGEGNVGTNLKEGLERAGYTVRTAGHEPKKVEEVARESEVLILAVPQGEVRNALDEMNGEHKGKVLIDVTNVLDEDYNFAGSLEESQAERTQSWAEDAKVVKAFNTVFAPTMSTGQANGDQLSVFIAGNDEESRATVRSMAEAIGFDAVDAGALENARYLETLGFLNITLGYKLGMGNGIGFRLIHNGSGDAGQE